MDTLTTFATSGNTYAITCAFTDDAGSSVAPDTLTWSLTDEAGTVINSRNNVSVSSPTASETIVLGADDLNSSDGVTRILSLTWTYTSDLGSGLTGYRDVRFFLSAYDPSTYNLRKYVTELRHALSIDFNDEMWNDDELKSYVNRSIRHIWTWLVRIDPTYTITRDTAYALVSSGILAVTEYDLPTGFYAAVSLGKEEYKYDQIDRRERLDRRGYYTEGDTTLFVSKVGSGGNQGSAPRDFTDTSYWTVSNLTAGTEAVACPDQTVRTTNTLTAGAANATVTQSLTVTSGYYTTSVYLKRKTGSGTVALTLDGSTYTNVNVTSSWKRFTASQSLTTSAQFGLKLVTSGDAVYADSFELQTPDLQTFRYLTYPTALTYLTDTDALPDNELRDWVVPLARIFAIQKEQTDISEDFKKAYDAIMAELRKNYPKVSSIPYAYGVDNESCDGFEA